MVSIRFVQCGTVCVSMKCGTFLYTVKCGPFLNSLKCGPLQCSMLCSGGGEPNGSQGRINDSSYLVHQKPWMVMFPIFRKHSSIVHLSHFKPDVPFHGFRSVWIRRPICYIPVAGFVQNVQTNQSCLTSLLYKPMWTMPPLKNVYC